MPAASIRPATKGSHAVRVAAAFALAIVAALLGGGFAFASCATPDADARCWSDFDRFGAVAWAGNEFVAVGHLRNRPDSDWALAHISADGRRGAVNELPPSHDENGQSNVTAVELQRIVPLPNGVFALIGWVHFTRSNWLAGIVLAVDASGRFKWAGSPGYTDANAMFRSGIYDASANIVIGVGRRTSGRDPDGTCRDWSQSYIQGFDASSGALVEPQILNGEPAPGPRNRQGLYDIAPAGRPGQYAFVGFQTVPDSTGARCTDEILAGMVAPGNRAGKTQWTIAPVIVFPDDGVGNEDGYAIRAVGPNEYVLAGQIGDYTNGPSLAHGVRFSINPTASNPLILKGSLDSPTGDLATAHGGARFRVVTPVGDASHLLFAGSASSTSKGGNASLTQVVSTDFSKVERPVVADGGAADIADAASSPKGQVLTAGSAIDDKGQRVGWLELFGSGAFRSDTAPGAVAGQRAVPDRSAPALLKSLARVGSAYQLPDSAVVGPSRYYLTGLPAGLPLDIAFSVPSPSLIHARVLVGSGHMDLTLSDGDGRLLDFSNNRGGAPQVLLDRLRPGKYTLSLLAENDVKDVEFDIGRAEPVDFVAISKAIFDMTPDARDKLSELLAKAGVSPPSEPSIGAGGETLLSLLAARDAGSKIDSRLLDQLPLDLLFGRR
jgi:hypothetical protein